jgi:hypothetical protein
MAGADRHLNACQKFANLRQTPSSFQSAFSSAEYRHRSCLVSGFSWVAFWLKLVVRDWLISLLCLDLFDVVTSFQSQGVLH